MPLKAMTPEQLVRKIKRERQTIFGLLSRLIPAHSMICAECSGSNTINNMADIYTDSEGHFWWICRERGCMIAYDQETRAYEESLST